MRSEVSGNIDLILQESLEIRQKSCRGGGVGAMSVIEVSIAIIHIYIEMGIIDTG
jgi:hypothetical protein